MRKIYLQEEVPVLDENKDTYLQVVTGPYSTRQLQFRPSEFQVPAKISIYTTSSQDCKHVWITFINSFMSQRIEIQPEQTNYYEYRPITYGKVRIELLNSVGDYILDQIINVDEDKWWIIGDYPYDTEVHI